MAQKENFGAKIWRFCWDFLRKTPTSASPLLPSSLPEVSYKYTTRVPSALQLRLADFLEYIPANWIRKEYLDKCDEETVELSCAEIFQFPIPRISVEALQNLLPRAFRIPKGIALTTQILLPIRQLALSYHWTTEREELPPSSPFGVQQENSLDVLPALSAEKSTQENEEEYLPHLEGRPSPAFFASLPVFVPKPVPSISLLDTETKCTQSEVRQKTTIGLAVKENNG